jgi:hypothetical protein
MSGLLSPSVAINGGIADWSPIFPNNQRTIQFTSLSRGTRTGLCRKVWIFQNHVRDLYCRYSLPNFASRTFSSWRAR